MLTLSSIATFQFFRVAKIFYPDFKDSAVLTFAMITLTPFWHYSGALYSENIICLFYMLAIAEFCKRRYVISGLCIAFSMLLKPVFAVVAVPFLVYLLYNKRVRDTLGMVAPILCGSLVFLASNIIFFGLPFRFPQEFQLGSVFVGFGGLWFSIGNGILGTSPILILLLAAWPNFIRKHGALSSLLFFSSVAYILIMSA